MPNSLPSIPASCPSLPILAGATGVSALIDLSAPEDSDGLLRPALQPAGIAAPHERAAAIAAVLPHVVAEGILFGADVAVAEWVKARIPHMAGREFGSCVALGILRNDTLVGGVVFNNHHRAAREIEVSGAVAPGFRIAPAGLRRILRYPFHQLGCERVTISTGRKNKAAQAFAERLGARLEGVKRRAFDGREDLMMYGLLADECPFLKGGRGTDREMEPEALERLRADHARLLIEAGPARVLLDRIILDDRHPAPASWRGSRPRSMGWRGGAGVAGSPERQRRFICGALLAIHS